jgi:transposase-like protein
VTKRVIVRLPSAGRVVVTSKDDKRFCKHENLVKYCIRDGYQYYWCNSCHNLLREEIEKPKMNVLDKIKNRIKGGK